MHCHNVLLSTQQLLLLQRFSKDTDEIDQQLISQVSMLINAGLGMLGSLGAIVVATPLFALVIAPLATFYLRIMNYFRSVLHLLV
jgi:ABC-type multidrug transport system fused ATPase/permease subunit